MKTSKNLFYSGLALVLSPILLLIFLWWVSSTVEDYNDNKLKKEKQIVYDTVKVKVVDTVVVQKIKYIKKIQSVSSDSTSK